MTAERPAVLRGVRVVGGDGALVDVVLRDGVVDRVVGHAGGATGGRPRGEVLHGGGRWVMPGLWDQHVHLDQWALQRLRVDTSGARSAADAARLVAERVRTLPDDGRLVEGFGHRSSGWPDARTAAALDAAGGGHPVVLVSGDAHHGWMSSAALDRLGLRDHVLPGHDGVVVEDPWFAAYARLAEVFGPDPGLDGALQAVLREASALGVVGIVDVEFGGAVGSWPGRVVAGLDTLRVRAATYEPGLDDVLARGLRTGDPLEPGGLVTMGPLKVITDGSLGTGTASCCEPYGTPPTRGLRTVAPDRLRALLARATAGGLTCAVHAIGDAAVHDALDAFTATGARGSIEHAQLLAAGDAARMAALGVTASVQPAHLLDDRDTTERLWPDRAGRCFPLRSMLDAGVRLALGSDAPVAPLDPWLAVAAAVHRSGDDRPPWHPEQAITVREALAASVDGRRVAPGQPADLVLLDTDPAALDARAATEGTAVAADALRATRPSATLLAGRVVHG